jgi:very-short-patch-repair endonuclease
MTDADVPDNLGQVCESPIERLLVNGFLECRRRGLGQVRFVTGGRLDDHLKAILDGSAERAGYRGLWLHIFPQARFGRYRVDFLVVAAGNVAPIGEDSRIDHRIIVVECDGKEFHQDEHRERVRNGFFVHECGFTVLHFTGAELWRNATNCADAVICHACDQLWQSPKMLDWHTGAFVPVGLECFAVPLRAALDRALLEFEESGDEL